MLRASWRALMSGRTLSDVVEGILDAARRVEQHHDTEFGEAASTTPRKLRSTLPKARPMPACRCVTVSCFPRAC